MEDGKGSLGYILKKQLSLGQLYWQMGKSSQRAKGMTFVIHIFFNSLYTVACPTKIKLVFAFNGLSQTQKNRIKNTNGLKIDMR